MKIIFKELSICLLISIMMILVSFVSSKISYHNGFIDGYGKAINEQIEKEKN